MPLSNYTELQANLADVLDRQDVIAKLPIYIALAEGRLRRELRARSVAEQVLSVSSGSAALPALVSLLRLARVNRSNYGAPMTQVTLEKLFDQREAFRGVAGVPQFYAVADNTIYLAPEPDNTYELRISYYELAPALSDAAPTNWLLTRYPDAYFYATLCEISVWLMEDERIPMWEQRFDKIVFQINRQYEQEELGANLRTPRLSQVF
jgi:hypothetical protein